MADQIKHCDPPRTNRGNLPQQLQLHQAAIVEPPRRDGFVLSHCCSSDLLGSSVVDNYGPRSSLLPQSCCYFSEASSSSCTYIPMCQDAKQTLLWYVRVRPHDWLQRSLYNRSNMRAPSQHTCTRSKRTIVHLCSVINQRIYKKEEARTYNCHHDEFPTQDEGQTNCRLQ